MSTSETERTLKKRGRPKKVSKIISEKQEAMSTESTASVRIRAVPEHPLLSPSAYPDCIDVAILKTDNKPDMILYAIPSCSKDNVPFIEPKYSSPVVDGRSNASIAASTEPTPKTRVEERTETRPEKTLKKEDDRERCP